MYYKYINISPRRKWKKIAKVKRNGKWYNVVESERTKAIYVSSYGEIKRIKQNGTEEITKGTKHKTASGNVYMYVCITCELNGKKHSFEFKVHRLVAYAFIPKPKNATLPHHLDDNGMNNNVTNLVWTNDAGNAKAAFDSGVRKNKNGELHYNSKLDNDVVENIIIPRLLNNESDKSIASYVKSLGYECNKNMISAIRNKQSWKELTKDLCFYQKFNHVPKEIIHKICELINSGYTNTKIVTMLNLDTYSKNPRRYVDDIRNKRSGSSISDLYF